MSLKNIAEEIVAVSLRGEYETEGKTVRFLEDQNHAVANTTIYSPERISQIRPQAEKNVPEVTLIAGTTQEVALELSKTNRVCLLNFASARNPGGGFLNGAKAQEEDLCRCSGLYQCLVQCDEYYTANRTLDSMLYTDYAIFSPSVPFFKSRGTGKFLPACFMSDVITMPAPNSHQYLSRNPSGVATLESTFLRRWENVLKIAHDQGVSQLLLGAWGCGAFGGDPSVASRTARAALVNYNGGLKKVVFAIPSRGKQSQKNYRAFAETFQPLDESTPARLPTGMNASQEPVLKLQVAPMRASTLTISTDERPCVCSGDYNGQLWAWDLSDLGNPRKFEVGLRHVSIRSATFLSNGALIVRTSDDGLFALSRGEGGNFQVMKHFPITVASSPVVLSNDMFAVVDVSGGVHSFRADPKGCDRLASVQVAAGEVYLGRIGGDGLIATCPFGNLYLWEDARELSKGPQVISGPRLAHAAATGDTSGTVFAASSSIEGLLIYERDSTAVWGSRAFSVGNELISNLSWLASDSLAIKLVGGPTVLVADRQQSGWKITELQGNDSVTRMCLDGEGGIVTGGFHGEVVHWTRRDGEWSRRLLGQHRGMVSELVVSQAFGAISVGYDGVLSVWGRSL